MKNYGVQIVVERSGTIHRKWAGLVHRTTVQAEGYKEAVDHYVNEQYLQDIKKWESEDACQYRLIDCMAWIIPSDSQPNYLDSQTHRLVGGFSS